MTLSLFLTPIVVPPLNLSVLALIAIVLRWRMVAVFCLLLSLSLSIPAVAESLLSSLEVGLPSSPSVAGAQAVLIVGGDTGRDDHDNARPGPLTLERLRAGAALARQTGLPIAVTGGPAWNGGPTIGAVMAASLAADFGMPARWVETESGTTWENAENSAKMLHADGINRVLLVTHGWHMRRAQLAFQESGLETRAAPLWLDRADLTSLEPTVSAWRTSYFALHEWIGLGWYELRALAH